MIDFASSDLKKIALEPQVPAKKALRKLLKKSNFNLLISVSRKNTSLLSNLLMSSDTFWNDFLHNLPY